MCKKKMCLLFEDIIAYHRPDKERKVKDKRYISLVFSYTIKSEGFKSLNRKQAEDAQFSECGIIV